MNKENLYKPHTKSKGDIKNDKVQKNEESFEEGKQELSVYEQIKLGIQQAIEVERTNKK
ncbi:MAG: hypothetical protein J6J39_07290 [Clostridia bacterium]|nr:hypothetical protein [Clostridia bacterium]